MELRHLRYFLAVAEELNFRRAAARVGIEQPPLSRQIKNLEDEIGTPLFRRRGRTTELTPAGVAFRSEAQQILGRCGAAVESARACAQGREGTLTIGYMPASFCYQPLLRSLQSFQRQFPRIRVVVVQMVCADQLEALNSGRIDLAIANLDELQDRRLSREQIIEEELDFIFPPDHPLVSRKMLRLRDLEDESFIIVSRRSSPALHDRMLGAWRARGIEPRIAQETDSFASTLALVSCGMGFSLAGRELRKYFAAHVEVRTIREFRLHGGSELVWNRLNVSPALESFLGVFRSQRAERAAAPTRSAAE